MEYPSLVQFLGVEILETINLIFSATGIVATMITILLLVKNNYDIDINITIFKVVISISAKKNKKE